MSRRCRVAAICNESQCGASELGVRSGDPGPVSRKIQEVYFATVKGEVDRYKDWLEHVR